MQGAVHRRHMSSVKEEFGHAEADDQGKGGKPGKETQGQQETAEKLGEDDQDQRDTMADVQRIREGILVVAVVLQFIETIEIAEKATKDHAKGECSQVEGGVGVGGGEEFFHV